MRRLCSFVAASALVLSAATAAFAQGTPPANPAPPPGYPPAAPLGYPQPPPAQPPAGQAVPPGYPPQQPQPPAYPYTPPPGYAPPPGYTPPPPPPPPPPAAKHGFQALLFLGINSFRGKAGEGLDPGLRLGTLLGARISNSLSLNGEFTIDVINVADLADGEEVTAVDVDLTFSPLLHAPVSPTTEVVLGPKLGFFGFAVTGKNSGVEVGSASAHGTAAGVNAGFLFASSPTVSLGVLLNFTLRSFSEYCVKTPSTSESCSSSNLPDAEKVIGFNGAVMF